MKLSKILHYLSNDVLCAIISLLHKSLPDIDGKICGLRSQLFQQNNLDTNLVLLQKVKRCLIVRRHQGLLLHFHLKLHLKYKLHVLHRKILRKRTCYLLQFGLVMHLPSFCFAAAVSFWVQTTHRIKTFDFGKISYNGKTVLSYYAKIDW